MSSVRQKKVSRIIQATVSDVIQNRLSDPRIRGMVSVTRIDISPDLRKACVYLSILGVKEKHQQLTLTAIKHAHGCIQSYLAAKLTMKVCPSLDFKIDESFTKTNELLKLIDELVPHSQPVDDETNGGTDDITGNQIDRVNPIQNAEQTDTDTGTDQAIHYGQSK